MRKPSLGAGNINYALLTEEPVSRSRWKGKKRYVFIALAVILAVAFALVVKFAPFWQHKPEPDKGLACSVFCSGPILGAWLNVIVLSREVPILCSRACMQPLCKVVDCSTTPRFLWTCL